MNYKMQNRTFPKPNDEVSTTSPPSSVSFLHAGWWTALLRSCVERWLHFNPDQQLADKETDLLRAEDGFVSVRQIRARRFLRLF